MTGGYQAPRCECGHTPGDHVSSGRRSLAGFMRSDFNGGRCLVDGCGCSRFACGHIAQNDGAQGAAMKRGGMSAAGPAGPPSDPPSAPRDAAWSANPRHPVWRS